MIVSKNKRSNLTRSEIMSQIRSKNTKPELVVRKALHRLGFRFRLHRRELPGSPDIVLPKYHTAIFVNGCFWHQHTLCGGNRIPATHREYWSLKLQRNVDRDKKNLRKLRRQGWSVLVLWECQLKKNASRTLERIQNFLLRQNLG